MSKDVEARDYRMTGSTKEQKVKERRLEVPSVTETWRTEMQFEGSEGPRATTVTETRRRRDSRHTCSRINRQRTQAGMSIRYGARVSRLS